MSHKRAKVRRAIFMSVLVLLVLSTTLALSEIALRLSGRVSTESVRVASDPTYDQIPGVFEPGQRVTERPRPELTHRVSINELGFRGPEVTLRKEPDTIRILCLGDSFTFGSFVNDEDTMPALLAQELARNTRSVEVINGGVGGSTIVDQAQYLRKAFDLNPDIVILTFSENDIDDLNKAVPLHVTMEANRKLKSGAAGIVYRMVRDTALFNFLLLLHARYMDYVTPRALAHAAGPPVEADHLWKLYESELRAMDAVLRARSIRFLFVIFPSDHRIGTSVAEASRLERIRKIAESANIETVNLLPQLNRSGLASTDLYLLPYDGHPSRRAYAIAAGTIASFLHSAGWLGKAKAQSAGGFE